MTVRTCHRVVDRKPRVEKKRLAQGNLGESLRIVLRNAELIEFLGKSRLSCALRFSRSIRLWRRHSSSCYLARRNRDRNGCDNYGCEQSGRHWVLSSKRFGTKVNAPGVGAITFAVL